VDDRLGVDLGGVEETLLWNLYQRGSEASRRHPVLSDPYAVALLDRVDYPFEERFGPPRLAQWQALLAACFDGQVRTFLAAHPDGTVVALGEGLETQFWRVDNGRVHWLSVDLPEVVDLRGRLLPGESDRQWVAACSALDLGWTAAAAQQAQHGDGSLLITAQGLLMYFQPDRVRDFLTRTAARFPSSGVVFDGVPAWFSARTMRGQMTTGHGYTTPPMPWALDKGELARLRAVPNVAAVTELRRPRGRGVVHGLLMPALSRVPGLRWTGLAGLPVVRMDLAAPRPS
jgi:O-methyltransferase involved in polyketide biosynthesis